MRHFSTLRMSIGYQAFLAAIIGILAGLFFGPYCSIVKPLGDVYIMLLQMVALPYLSFSIIHGLGSMAPVTGKKLFRQGWHFWVFLWALIFAIIFLLSFLIPKPIGSVIVPSMTSGDSSLAHNFLSYIVPENPFYDLANNIVPAITVFGIIGGTALMHVEKKEGLLSILEKLNQTIELIFKWIAILSPIGVFAHLAVALGTVYFDDLFLLEFYVGCFIFVSLYMTLWVLPGILSSLTPLSYRDVLHAFKVVCVVPFATALSSLSLPFIIYYLKKLGTKHADGDPQFHATTQTVMPICYSFGQIGNGLILFFMLFISFFYRHPFSGSEKTLLSALTIPMSIGSSATSVTAVTFLINQLNFPPSAGELYDETLALTLNFQVLLSVASVLTFIILVLYAYYGLLEIKIKKLATHLLLSFSLFGLLVYGAKHFTHLTDNYQNLYPELSLQEVIKDPVQAKILNPGEFGTPRTTSNSNAETFSEILTSGVLKVGYDPFEIPYCYFNRHNQLVGFDVAYAYQLARDLDCRLEFVPIDFSKIGPDLNAGLYDIAMAAILMTVDRIRDMDFTNPYSEQNNVLVIPTKNTKSFLDLTTLVQTPNLHLGAFGAYEGIVKKHFPLATLIPYHIDNTMLDGKVDAWVWSTRQAFVWCLNNPGFTFVDYDGLIGKSFFAYPIRAGSLDLASFLNKWLILTDESGFKDRMTQYWIQGENPKQRSPRWSILRNVLHWIE